MTTSGLLHHVGFTSAIKREHKPALTAKLEALIAKPGFTGNAPGGPSRWSTERSAQWCPLKPKLVVEVCYDHFSGERFRHGTSILRWRPDKARGNAHSNSSKQKTSIRGALAPEQSAGWQWLASRRRNDHLLAHTRGAIGWARQQPRTRDRLPMPTATSHLGGVPLAASTWPARYSEPVIRMRGGTS